MPIRQGTAYRVRECRVGRTFPVAGLRPPLVTPDLFGPARSSFVTHIRGRYSRAVTTPSAVQSPHRVQGGNPAILNYNPSTGTVVVQSPTGEFVSGWRVSQAQAANILNQGKLGGG